MGKDKDAKKKEKKEEEQDEVEHQLELEAFLNEMSKSSNSIQVVTQVLEETIMQKAAEHLYN